MTSPTKPEHIKSFVQNTLGCTCPDSVFDKQEFESGITISNVDDCKKLCVGEKLLIYLINTGAITDLSSTMKSLISEGRKERDSKNLNRFRLVLGTEDIDAVSKEADTIFKSMDDLDDKAHIHIISRHEVEKVR